MLTNEERGAIARILKAQPDVVAAYLFGSQNRGNAGKESDVDVGVVLDEKGGSLGRELELEREISKVVGREVDVRILSFEQSPVFLMQAAQGDLLVGYDRWERVAFEVGLAKLHDDAQQYFRIARHYIK